MSVSNNDLRISGLPVKIAETDCRGIVMVDPLAYRHMVMTSNGAWYWLSDAEWEPDLDPETWYYCLLPSGKLIELVGSAVLDYGVRGIVGKVDSVGLSVPSRGVFLGRMENDKLIVVKDLRSWFEGSVIYYNERGIVTSEWRPALNIKCVVPWEIGQVCCGWVRCSNGRCYRVEADSGENYGLAEPGARY